MKIEFGGKSVLVTGAGKGIGRDIAALLTECGARVIALSRSYEDLATLNTEIGCETIATDLNDLAVSRKAIQEAGPIDLLVNNAGISIPQSAMETSVEAMEKTLRVNVEATLMVSQVVAAGMMERGGGAIVNISSQASARGLADHAAYCASKGAIDQLTRVLALEWGPKGIRVNAINPTVTLTPMGAMAWGDPAKSGPMLARIPIGRFATPREVSYVVAFLLSDYAAMIHGAVVPVDGGYWAA